MARLLLRGGRLEEALPLVAHRLAQALGLPSVALELRAVDGDERRVAFPLREHTRQIGTLLVPGRACRRRSCTASSAASSRSSRRCWRRRSSATSCSATSSRRRALRRTDVLKTALLRAVSHDLRSPLTAILAAADALGSPGDHRRRARASSSTTSAREATRLVAPHRQPARPLAAGGRTRPSRGASGARSRRCSRPPPRTSGCPTGTFRLSIDPRPPAGPRRRRPARARVREPAGERQPPLRRPPGLGPRPRGRPADHRPRRRPRPGHPVRAARPDLRAVLPLRHRAHGPPRLGPRAGHRARLRRGQRRDGVGRVAPRAGHDVRRRAAARRARARRRSRPREPARPRRRRRAADPARAARRAARGGLRRAAGRRRRRRRSTPPRCRPPDAAIVDLVLPDGDGIEVTPRAARVDARRRSSCSAPSARRTRRSARCEAGADDYVTKPFGPRELVARLEAVLRRARRRRTSRSCGPRASSSTSPRTRSASAGRSCASPRRSSTC